jgi:hypothetical protein
LRFSYLLAGHLRMIRAEMLARMSNREFEAWKIVYYRIDPFGDFRADLRNGLFACAIINLLEKHWFKNPRTHQPSEFVIDLLKKTKVGKGQSWQEMRDAFKAIAENWNKKKKPEVRQVKRG